MQVRHTIAKTVTATGTALHAGVPVTVQLAPGAAGQGVVFRRTDLGGEVSAQYDRVKDTKLGTVIVHGNIRVAVIEHLMAAAAGLEIDDLLVILDGPEPPILDGDALSYLTLLEGAGRVAQPMYRAAIKVLKPVTVEQDGAQASLLPDPALSFSYDLSFPVIGEQHYKFAFTPAAFKEEIAPARTFGFLSELETLNSMNLAKGASLENTLALDDTGVTNAALQRFPDEFVRHKILDAVGDLALAGSPLIGRFVGVKSGHATNNALLRALFSDKGNFRKVVLS